MMAFSQHATVNYGVNLAIPARLIEALEVSAGNKFYLSPDLERSASDGGISESRIMRNHLRNDNVSREV